MAQLPTHGPDGSEILSVSEFTRRVKVAVEQTVGRCWVRGEISNLTNHGSGHVYFSLKDARSQVRCVLFRQDALRLGAPLRAGQEIVALGDPSVYEPQGSYQLVCRVVVDVGQGELQRRYQALKAKLEAEGLFDASRKRPLPQWPTCIAVVTSPTGAAIADFTGILRRRGFRGRVIVIPSRVQGQEAAEELVAGIRQAGALQAHLPAGQAVPQLLVLMRGGGSLEDLWPFNEEAVARALAASPIPTISAVGHQVDFTLGDFAADLRAETPSGAAELIATGFCALLERQQAASSLLGREVERQLQQAANAVRFASQGLRAAHPRNLLEQYQQRLDEWRGRLFAAASLRLGRRHLRLMEASRSVQLPALALRLQRLQERSAAVNHRLRASARGQIRVQRERVQSLAYRLEGLNLQQTLLRGFALVRNQQGGVVSRKAGLIPGQLLALDFADGEIIVRVEQV